jgi:peptidoglycan hydrolase-like protein with peptidoglycan-binding domain
VAGVLGAATAALVLTRAGPTTASASPAPDTGLDATGHPRALELVSSSPAPQAADVPSDAALTVRFTAPLASDTPTPVLDPPVAGTWMQTTPGTLAFDAAAPLPPGANVSVTVPGGDQGVKGSHGQRLAQTTSSSFTVAGLSTLRTQQLLATLGYLPVSFTPADTNQPPNEAATAQVGTFSWRWASLPGNFMSLWSPGEPNLVTQGAIMAFQTQQHLGSDGVAGPKVWQALLRAAAAGQTDSDGHYDWVDVVTALPQHVVVWRDGQVAYTTPANTGIRAAPTELGTWPVYVRYTSTTMSGTNPDGSHYSDPGVPWVSYFPGGDALHGFIRPSYGSPQSLGCVELPPSNAQVVYPYTPIGTLVTVE